ncbi:MAG TPA: C4-type zinc ribbon domain-containing protein [Amoebophilaceae bacterium]|jgi:predicted  nucleic acid-binding Zn-ribbon protein|nr:C4-type zinc ribbon domain-containing protein [Amoebophilaceae bacterium]
MDKTISHKLTKLSELQNIDLHLDGILKLRGTLPDEVNLLRIDIQNRSLQIQEQEALTARLQEEIVEKKEFVKQTENKVQKYEAQQMEVRNNREYDAITKELELHKLDIQLANKFLRTAYQKIEQEKNAIEELKRLTSTQQGDLAVKQKELDAIFKATEQEEEALHQTRTAILNDLDEPLYLAYERIRKNAVNNLAVVSIKKGACGGCCIVIPPHQKLGVYERNKIVLCEHCGRMLIVPEHAMDTLNVLTFAN